ncbi:MAG: HD domain-containing protein [Acidobacteriota bacterium]|nr:HD domain-containing protein [Acidobacteriota bacterium]
MTPTTSGTNEQDVKDRGTALLAAARDEYATDARRGRGGREVVARLAGRMDALVRTLVDAAQAGTTAPLAVCALGGYGRQALCLHSDLDILIVFDGPIGPAEERFIKGVLQPLWDLRLSLGQHVRELADLDVADLSNPEFLLGLLDARLLAGDARVFSRMLEQAHDPVRLGALVDPLLDLVQQRHAQYNDTLYQLEPDIKQAPGGLRDIAACRHLRLLQPDVPHDAAAAARMLDAEDYLLRIRSLLHLEAGRDVNLLTHELQERVADMMGSAGAHAHRRVEALMGDYFRAARVVARSLAQAQRAVRPPAGDGTTRPVGRQFEIAPDGVRFVDLDRAASQPSLWLEAFRIAIDRECGVSEQALACIEQSVHRCSPDDFVATAGERHQLRHVLRPRKGLYARLSEMHDCGLLTRIFPEFEKIQCRVIRDFYHKYTVDEHTLLAIRNVESLLDPQTPGRKRFGSILQEVRSPELLTLALLFHDVGKWREADHAQESLRLAQTMLDRLELTEEARHTVEFLIRQHLQMSQAAFRRDSEDPQVVARLAQLVGTEEQLKMLCLLTLADVGAVSPETLTPWKEDLLWRLYVDTYNRLTLGYADDLLEHDQSAIAVLIAGRPDDISETELTRFLEGLPRRYLASFGLGTVYRHVRLARNIVHGEVHAFLENHDAIWELTLVTLDKPFLFSNVSGVLSYFGMDIHRGQAMTTPDGLVLDVFEFSDEEAFLGKNPTATGDICRMLENVVAGAVDVTSLLAGRMRSILYRRGRHEPPVVHFDNEHSRKFTVLEIVADDAPGLLYRISRVISGQGCDVELVLIATEGKRAVDVLHVMKEGGKLSEMDQGALKQELERVLEAGNEAH